MRLATNGDCELSQCLAGSDLSFHRSMSMTLGLLFTIANQGDTETNQSVSQLEA